MTQLPDNPLFITPEIARQLELAHAWRAIHYARAYAMTTRAVGCQVMPVGGGFAVFAGPGAVVNGASALGMNGPLVNDDFDYLEAMFFERGEPARLTACPLADPSLLLLAGRRGYTLAGYRSLLARAVPAYWHPGPPPPDINISLAAPLQGRLWVYTSAQGFDDTDTPAQQALDILTPNFYAENSACYFAWYGSEPAGSGAMYLHENVVELGGASTRQGYRRRGIQRALIETRLSHASTQGCDTAIIITEPGSDSQRNAERLGFRLAYTQALLIKNRPAS